MNKLYAEIGNLRRHIIGKPSNQTVRRLKLVCSFVLYYDYHFTGLVKRTSQQIGSVVINT